MSSCLLLLPFLLKQKSSNSRRIDYHSPITRKVRQGHVVSSEPTCVLKLKDFLDHVFESLLYSYGDGKSVIQKFQQIVNWLFYIHIHNIQRFYSLFGLFFEASHLQEVEIRHLIRDVQKQYPFCFMAKLAITYQQ